MAVLDGPGLTISQSAGGVVAAGVMAGIRASLVLLLLVGCATPDWQGHNPLERSQEDAVAAHPEWPPEIRGAVASWRDLRWDEPGDSACGLGIPPRISSDGSELNSRDVWHYPGRQHNADLMAVQMGGAQPSAEWTVWFADGGVMGWTE